MRHTAEYIEKSLVCNFSEQDIEEVKKQEKKRKKKGKEKKQENTYFQILRSSDSKQCRRRQRYSKQILCWINAADRNEQSAIKAKRKIYMLVDESDSGYESAGAEMSLLISAL